MATDGKQIHDDRIVIEDTSTRARDGDIMNLEALPTEEVTCEECTHTVSYYVEYCHAWGERAHEYY
jgi:hypothetical protein